MHSHRSKEDGVAPGRPVLAARRFFLVKERELAHNTISQVSVCGGSMADYLIRFVAALEPNEAVYWLLLHLQSLRF
ncbi:hypothetical protein A0H81_14781 [Grifola frondosa]|uniref:Uncharacterized protein n=1 Tax=Grifola frondosa TaxID=5627 RepID=A0A1C7LKL2_GRIFR|nr:hypothetical protein A0H81_14781 [Grifola frondosa]